MKNPKTHLSQTNIGLNQQVNNSSMREEEVHSPKSEPDLKNELLEKTDGKRLDFGKAGTTVNVDSVLEAVGKVDRAKNSGRQSASVAECY